MNKVFLLGNLGCDPVPISNGASMSLATTHWDGKEQKTMWHNVLVFGQQGLTCLKNKKKGDKLLIEGRIELNKNGNHIIFANNITFL